MDLDINIPNDTWKKEGKKEGKKYGEKEKKIEDYELQASIFHEFYPFFTTIWIAEHIQIACRETKGVGEGFKRAVSLGEIFFVAAQGHLKKPKHKKERKKKEEEGDVLTCFLPVFFFNDL